MRLPQEPQGRCFETEPSGRTHAPSSWRVGPSSGPCQLAATQPPVHIWPGPHVRSPLGAQGNAIPSAQMHWPRPPVCQRQPMKSAVATGTPGSGKVTGSTDVEPRVGEGPRGGQTQSLGSGRSPGGRRRSTGGQTLPKRPGCGSNCPGAAHSSSYWGCTLSIREGERGVPRPPGRGQGLQATGAGPLGHRRASDGPGGQEEDPHRREHKGILVEPPALCRAASGTHARWAPTLRRLRAQAAQNSGLTLRTHSRGGEWPTDRRPSAESLARTPSPGGGDSRSLPRLRAPCGAQSSD